MHKWVANYSYKLVDPVVTIIIHHVHTLSHAQSHLGAIHDAFHLQAITRKIPPPTRKKTPKKIPLSLEIFFKSTGWSPKLCVQLVMSKLCAQTRKTCLLEIRIKWEPWTYLAPILPVVPLYHSYTNMESYNVFNKALEKSYQWEVPVPKNNKYVVMYMIILCFILLPC